MTGHNDTAQARDVPNVSDPVWDFFRVLSAGNSKSSELF